MTNTYKTGNPLGSTSVKDLSDNASNMDEGMNSPSPSFNDRFGKRRETWAGMESAFQDFLVSSGFEPVHLMYVDGSPLTVVRPTQLIDRGLISYRVKTPAQFPVGLSGNWATDAALLVEIDGNSTLRQDLGSNDAVKGAQLISFDQFGVQLQGGAAIAAKGFWNDRGVGTNITRLRDRVFVGGATVNDGNQNNVIKDWLETERQYTTNNGNMVVLSTIGQGAIVAGSKTSDSPDTGSMGCIALEGWAINDNTAQLQTAYAMYLEARRKDGAGITHGMEIDIVNQGSSISIQPYGIVANGSTMGAWIAAGGEVVGSNQASAAIAIVNNGSPFEKGIVFHNAALSGTDGVTGNGVAIEMAAHQIIRWMFLGGQLGAQTYSTVSDPNNQQSLIYSDVGMLYRNSADRDMFRVGISPLFANGLLVTPGNAGTGPTIGPIGPDLSIDLQLAPKGGGTIHFTGLAISASAGARIGYATVRINGTLCKIEVLNAS